MDQGEIGLSRPHYRPHRERPKPGYEEEEMTKMRATLLAGALTLIVLAIVPAASGASAANERCVGVPPCFATRQEAVDAAHAGDVIRIGPGTFAGGVTIDKSVE